MSCPFPGMDPFLEDPALWPQFHRQLVAELRGYLAPALTDRYTPQKGSRTYDPGGDHGDREQVEDYLEIRRKDDGRQVTLIDVVSPANKTTDAGRQAYLDQRQKAREAGANLVEIDLVLHGEPTLDYSREGLPEWHYAITVTRATQPKRYEIYTATLGKRLPRFRLPLAADDRDAVVDLQAVFSRCYDSGGYTGRIDYGRDPVVPWGDDKRRWVTAWLCERKLRSPPHEEVASLAYQLWQEEGCPHGRHREHWVTAEDKVRKQLAEALVTSGVPRKAGG